MAIVTMSSAALSRRPEVLVTVHHATVSPSAEDWTSYCAQCKVSVEAALAKGVGAVNLVFTDGPGPNSAQRREIADVVRVVKGKSASAVVSGNTLVRGVCTALRWVGIAVSPFAPQRWQEALAHVGVTSAEDIAEVRGIVQALAGQVGARPKSLAPFATLSPS